MDLRCKLSRDYSAVWGGGRRVRMSSRVTRRLATYVSAVAVSGVRGPWFTYV